MLLCTSQSDLGSGERAARCKRYFATSISHVRKLSGFSAHELNRGDAGQPLWRFLFFVFTLFFFRLFVEIRCYF